MKYKAINLKSGIKLVTITSLSSNAVTIAAFLKAGFRFDPVNKPGLAHFTEHMVFDGTKSFPNAREEAQAIEQYGGWHMAFTWIEHQKHTVHIPKPHFEIGIKILLETIYKPLIKDIEVSREKGVVQEEILKNLSDPSRAIWDYVWMPLFFQNTHVGRPYTGTIDDLQNISRDDVRQFISDNYTADKIVILVAGDLEHEQIVQAIEKESVSLDRLEKKRNIVKLLPKRATKVLVYEDQIYAQAAIFVGVETVPYISSVKPIFDIIREILGGYFGANLVQTLRNEGGLIYDWGCFEDNFTESGYIVFNVSTAPQNVEKVISIILNEFDRLAKGKITEKEIERAKGHLIGSIYANVEKGLDYIDWFGMQELMNPNNVLNIGDQIKIYNKITKSDVKNICAQYLNKDKILIGVLGEANETSIKKLTG